MTDIRDAVQDVVDILDTAPNSVAKTANEKHKTVGINEAFTSFNSQEQQQWQWSSGVLGVRQYTANNSFDYRTRRFDSPYAALNMHNHPNYNLMPGFSEMTTFIAGRYIQWRHQDYKLRRSVFSSDATEAATELVYSPPVPASVLAKPTGVAGATLDTVGDTQAKYMNEQYTTNKADVAIWLTYAEVWWEAVADTIPDEGDSFRHAEVSNSIEDAYKAQSAYRATGQKNGSENVSVAPVEVVSIDDDGNAVYGIAHTRMLVKQIGNMGDAVAANRPAPYVNVGVGSSHGHIIDTQMTDQQAQDLISGAVASVTLTSSDKGHSHTYVITYTAGTFSGTSTGGHEHEVLIENALTGNFPYDKAKAIAGTYDSTNKFKLIRDVSAKVRVGSFASLANRSLARFEVEGLDRVCELIPGLDGEGASIIEENPSYSISQIQDRDGGQLNSAYYNRRHQYATNDAGGRTTADRGFNDSNMFVAMTDNPNVIHGRSYMIPIEILALAPVDSWNPYNFAEDTRTNLITERLAGKGVDEANPYTAKSNYEFFYQTPYALYADEGETDPADTGKSAWVLDDTATARKVYSSGMRIKTPDNVHRRRFPVYPLAQQFSYESVQMEALKVEVKTMMKSILNGSATEQDIEDFM